jgi:hypothetical protein
LPLRGYNCKQIQFNSTIYTDHKSLSTLLNQRKLNGRQSRWIEEIWCYEHQIKWNPGECNLADPFSRCPKHEDITVHTLTNVAIHALDDHMDLIRDSYCYNLIRMRITKIHPTNVSSPSVRTMVSGTSDIASASLTTPLYANPYYMKLTTCHTQSTKRRTQRSRSFLAMSDGLAWPLT